ncbi:hypothetical protein ACJMK2_040720 [Sinanodonta woodiana]|uniref:Centromere protein W n=1 Tax=Sinanodonta woodiana TaxID=1069815 RepID=A0ABD3W1W2_SINWO
MPSTKVPKPKLKKGIKRRQKNTKALSANVVLMVWLDYLLNLTRLSQQAGDKAREEKTSIISPTHVKAVTKTVYKGCKG